nr:MAG TPA: hypothetical protein [Caudoviricetes sp.]
MLGFSHAKVSFLQEKLNLCVALLKLLCFALHSCASPLRRGENPFLF